MQLKMFVLAIILALASAISVQSQEQVVKDDLATSESHLSHSLPRALVIPHGVPRPHQPPTAVYSRALPVRTPYSGYPTSAAAVVSAPLVYSIPTPKKESSVHRNPYEGHDAYDAIRTQDADLAPHNPYNNPYLAPHAAAATKPSRYQHDQAKIPDCAYTNKHYYNLTFCLQDDYYPTETIRYELERQPLLVDRLLSDITYQSADNLVDGLTRAEEEGYTYEHYYGRKKNMQHTNPHDYYGGYSYAEDYYKSGGYICPSDIFYGRPKRAINTYGQWKVIVNLPDDEYATKHGSDAYQKFTQTHRMEQCMYPGVPCSYVDPKYHSQCLQKHNFVRLLAYTYDEGLHIDSFKLPVACSCQVSEPRHYGHGYGHHQVSPIYPTPAPYLRGK